MKILIILIAALITTNVYAEKQYTYKKANGNIKIIVTDTDISDSQVTLKSLQDRRIYLLKQLIEIEEIYNNAIDEINIEIEIIDKHIAEAGKLGVTK